MLRSVESGNRQNQKGSALPAASSLPGRHAAQPESRLLRLQAMHGNQGVQRLLRDGVLQRKLTINQPGDAFEQEADRVAEKVMRMPDPQSARGTGIFAAPRAMGIQRVCNECEEELHRSLEPVQTLRSQSCEQRNSDSDEEGNLRAKEVAGHTPDISESTSAKIDAMRGHGHPLQNGVRNFFEPRLGYDFSGVRIHTNQQAAESAHEVRALAYTIGRDIVFGSGQFAPESVRGRRLIAHELVHVVQQNDAKNTTGLDRFSKNARDGESESVAARWQSNAKASHAISIQRMGDLHERPPGLSCPLPNTSSGTVISNVLFGLNSNALTPGGIADVASFIGRWNATGTRPQVRVDGFASVDGPQAFNWTLSCNRAEAVVHELTHPTGGNPGIPAGSIDKFAQGATSEFSTNRDENRRATISADFSVPPVPVCANPGDSRTLDLQPVFLRNDPADASPSGSSWSRRFNEANRIWGKLGVTFNELSSVTIDTPLKTNGGGTIADRNAVRALRSGAGVEVFLVDSDFNDPPDNMGGAATAPGCAANGKIAMSDRGASDTLLAHELGHTLGLQHPGAAGNAGDPGTIMEPSGSNAVSNPTRNTTVNFSRILCPAPTGSTCLHPDP